MPTVERNEEREHEILAQLRARPRLEGQHVTDTIYCNVKAWGFARLGASGDAPAFSDATLLKFLMGHGMAGVLEQGHVSQIETIAPDTTDVGTIDIWMRDHPIEIKVTSASVLRDIAEQDHWLQQLGEYAWRATARERKHPWGELWALHLLGDWGKKKCPNGHGIPLYTAGEKPFRRKNPETNRPNLACPVPGCWELLVAGDRSTMLRCSDITWEWGELDSLHEIHAWRQRKLSDFIADVNYQPGYPPPIEWGYDFECRDCPVKERIGCPGRDLGDLQLEGSILEVMQQLEE